MTNIAISYARFSSTGQAEGGSLARQLEGAQAYADANGLVIDHSLSFRDLGVSAWDRSNITKGALGLFMKLVAAGKVPAGATLIVESFDRLSRATPRQALPIFTDIINAGLKIVTLTTPPKMFSAQSLDENMFQLMEALIDMSRAHGESERKSDLLGKSWATRRTKAVATKRVMTSKAPHWIITTGLKDDKVFSLNTERVLVVKRIVAMAMSGIGNHTITKTLNTELVPAWSRSLKEDAKRGTPKIWEPSYIQKILTSISLYGAVKVKGNEIIEGYYPPVMTHEDFLYLQSVRGARGRRVATNRQGKSVTNLFSGLCKCGYCGWPMNVSSYKASSGEMYRYLGCYGGRTGATKCKMHSWPIGDFEDVMLFKLAQIDYSKLVGTKSFGDIDAERKQLASLQSQATDTARRIENGHNAVFEGMKGLGSKIEAMELDLLRIQGLVKAQELKVSALASQEGGGGARPKALIDLFKKLKRTTDELQLRALREQLQAGIVQAVETVRMFPAGRNARETKADRFAEITFRNGAVQLLDPEECGA